MCLAENQKDLSDRFAKSGSNKWEGTTYADGLFGAPLLPGVAAVLECGAWATHAGGDHVLFIAEVKRFRTFQTDVPWCSAKGDTPSFTKPSLRPRFGRSTFITEGAHAMLKTGSQHAQSLKDGRQIFINGHIAEDVGEHPAFRRTLRTVEGLFDFAARPENAQLMTFEPSDAGLSRVNRIWQLPRSYEESRSAPARARSLGGTPCRFPRPLAGPCRLVSLWHGHGARRVRGL